MAFNNETCVTSHKKNLTRVNRLHDGKGFPSFDNAGFEEDGHIRQTKEPDLSLFSIEETYPQTESSISKHQDENKNATSRRRLPNEPVYATSFPTPKQNITESFELKVQNDVTTQQQEQQQEQHNARPALATINPDSSTNNKNSENDCLDSNNQNPRGAKASKMTFNVNLKRFEATTASSNNNADPTPDRQKLSRQPMTVGWSTHRRGSDALSAVVAAAKFTRSSSLRMARKGPPRLLRDLSLSDADDSDTKDYGHLKNINLPRRTENEPPCVYISEKMDFLGEEFANLNFELFNIAHILSSLPPTTSSSDSSPGSSSDMAGILDSLRHELTLLTYDLITLDPVLSSFLGPLEVETVAILESLIHELIKRGKIYQAAVLDIEEADVLASVPSGMLTKTDALGMTKSIICQPSLFRLQVGDVDYSCFKHRQDAVQGRNDELVMVMQMTRTCVVVGFSRDDSPGSCNSEVHEFVKVLEDAGW